MEDSDTGSQINDEEDEDDEIDIRKVNRGLKGRSNWL